MGSNKQERKHHWFLKTDDTYTKEVLLRELPPQSFRPDEPDADGNRHEVFAVGPREYESIMKHRSAQHLKFTLYVREDRGKMRVATFSPSDLKRP